MSYLQLESIEKNYETERKKTSRTDDIFKLKIMDLTIHKGEFFALLGPSGCGKTTLLKIISGLITPNKGDIFLDSRKITSVSPEKRYFGMVFQQPLLFPHMTVGENVAFGLKMQGISKKERSHKAGEILDAVGLAGLESRYPSELSGGQQQRVSLARAMVVKPPVLLMDEPFSALDPGLKNEMRQLIKTMHKDYETTILFVTHDREEAFLLADRIAVMEQGEILQVRSPRELYEKPNMPSVALFLGAQNVMEGEVVNGKFISDHIEWNVPLSKDGQNEKGWLVLRPESLQIIDVKKIHNASQPILENNNGFLKGVVKQVSFYQGFYYIKAELGSQNLEIIQKSEPDFHPVAGAYVFIQYDMGKVQFIPDNVDERRKY